MAGDDHLTRRLEIGAPILATARGRTGRIGNRAAPAGGTGPGAIITSASAPTGVAPPAGRSDPPKG